MSSSLDDDNNSYAPILGTPELLPMREIAKLVVK